MEGADSVQRNERFSAAEEFSTQERLEELRGSEIREFDDPTSIISYARKKLVLPLSQLEAVKKGAVLEKRVQDNLGSMKKKYPERYEELVCAGIDSGYQNVLQDLESNMLQIGTFDLAHNQHNYTIDLGNTNASNTFTAPTGENVKIQWYVDRLESIIKKLKRADLWRNFRNNETAKNFLELKYKHSLLEGVVAEEMSKVSEEIYDSQTILNAFKIDENSYTGRGKPLLKLCKKILEPKTLERLSPGDPGNVETRALLRQILILNKNPDTKKNLRKLLEKRAKVYSKKKKNKNKKEQVPDKLPSRSLLYLIVEDELKQAAVTVENGLHRQAILRTNLLIAACETSDKSKLANNAIANELKSGWGNSLKKALNRLRSTRYFSPLFTLEDALSHTMETIPDLKMFKNINILSTRADLMDNILSYEYETQEAVTPARLRQLAGYLEQFIKGTRIEGKVFKVIDRDIPKIESIMHVLRLVAEERMARKFIDDLNEHETNIEELKEQDRQEVILGLLKQKNEARKRMDAFIEESIEDRQQNFYKFFLAKNLKKEFKEAIDETEDMGYALRQEALMSHGLTKQLRKRGAVAIRTPHILKKTSRALALGATSPIWGPFKLVKAIGKKAYKRWISPVMDSPEFKERMNEQKEMRKSMIAEPLIRIAGSIPYFCTFLLTRPKYWSRSISRKIVGNKKK